MKLERNPFQFGSELGANELVGRKDEIARVESVIRDGLRLFLVGPRRYGKTSILRAAQKNLCRAGAVAVYINVETCADIENLIAGIVAGASNQLLASGAEGVSETARFFSRLKPEFRFGGDGKELSVSIGAKVSQDKNRQLELLTDTLDSLDRLAGAQPESRPVGLIIDEFSTLMARGGEQAEAKIRSITQCHQNVGYVFAGSDIRLMADMTMKHSRPFYRGGSNYYVGQVPTPEFAAWLHKQFRRSSFAVSGNEPIDLILSLAEDVPYNVQMLAHNCWEELRSQGGSKPTRLTVSLVQSVLKRTINRLDPYFAQMWNHLTPAQQKALVAFVRGNGEHMSSSQTALSVNLSVSSLQSAFRALDDQHVLWKDFSAGKSRVRFGDPFFAQWIRMLI